MKDHMKNITYPILLWVILVSMGWGEPDPLLQGSPPFSRHYKPSD